MHAPSLTRGSKGPRQQDLSPYTGSKSSLQCLFYFPFEKSALTINSKNFPLILREIGLHTFVKPLVKCLVSNLQNLKRVNADSSSFSFRPFLIMISTIAMSSNLFLRFLKPDCPKFRCSHKVDFSTPLYFYQDFGLHNIANPNAMNLELHSMKLWNGQWSLTTCQYCATCPLHCFLWSHTLLLAFGTLCFMISWFSLQGLENFNLQNPDIVPTCKSNSPCGLDLRSYSSWA
jgi:hypothetical protein